MKTNNIVMRLALLIIPLALLAAGAGVFAQGSGQAYPFETLRGEKVMVQGHGLYRYDTVNSSAQELGQDVVTLIIGIPLLLAGSLWSRKGSLRGQLLLTGALGYFLYTYAAMSFLTAFNPLFLVYVALFSISLFGFILAMRDLDAEEIKVRMASGFPRRAIAAYFILVAAFLSLAWLGLVVPAILRGTPPAGLESAITMVIQALDLGVIVPTSVITGVLLLKNRAWGYALSSVVLLKMLTMGIALIAMIISQILAGVTVDPLVSVIFVLISLAGIVLGTVTLSKIQDRG
jgi:hypothetical protein